MIFVTVGTHEQPFDRLLKEMDRLVETGVITEEVFIQSGYTDYQPKHCGYSKLLPYSDMEKYVKEARIVITHGGPSSFIMPLQVGKTPIVVPRQEQFGEHVNDHQLTFALEVAKRQKNILVIEDIRALSDAITGYEARVAQLSSGITSNNSAFCEAFARKVDELLRK